MAAYLVLERDGEFLLLQRKNTGYKDGMYSLVSGHVDEGEKFTRAMVREAEEEVGIEIAEEDLEVFEVLHRNSEERTYINVFFEAEAWEGRPENMEPEKCGGLKWVDRENLPDNTVYYVEEVLRDKYEKIFSQPGWEK